MLWKWEMPFRVFSHVFNLQMPVRNQVGQLTNVHSVILFPTAHRTSKSMQPFWKHSYLELSSTFEECATISVQSIIMHWFWKYFHLSAAGSCWLDTPQQSLVIWNWAAPVFALFFMLLNPQINGMGQVRELVLMWLGSSNPVSLYLSIGAIKVFLSIIKT